VPHRRAVSSRDIVARYRLRGFARAVSFAQFCLRGFVCAVSFKQFRLRGLFVWCHLRGAVVPIVVRSRVIMRSRVVGRCRCVAEWLVNETRHKRR
jgi:hypothetical protein